MTHWIKDDEFEEDGHHVLISCLLVCLIIGCVAWRWIRHDGVERVLLQRGWRAKSTNLKRLAVLEVFIDVVLGHFSTSKCNNLIVWLVRYFYVRPFLIWRIIYLAKGKGEWAERDHSILISHDRCLINFLRQECFHWIDEKNCLDNWVVGWVFQLGGLYFLVHVLWVDGDVEEELPGKLMIIQQFINLLIR